MFNIFKPEFRVKECLDQIRECLEQGWTGLGFKTLEFEKAWIEYTKLPNAHFLNSATAGLHLAVKILKDHYNWEKDDEIITTPFTFVSTNHAILYENLKPIFADIDFSLNLNPASVKARISKKTKAIMFVGIGGNAKNLMEICKIAKQHNLKIILDASHMAGTRINSQHVGHNIDVTIFSFQAVKNLPTADSGMICFKNLTFDKIARKLSWLGIDKDTYQRAKTATNYKWKYDITQTGFKYHGNSIIASLGLVGLKYLDKDNEYRRKLASKYIECLKTNSKCKIVEHEDCESSRHLFQVIVENRDDIIRKLNNIGINPGVHYQDNQEYSPYKHNLEVCPNCKHISQRILSLPLHMKISIEDIQFISKSLNQII